MKHTKGYSTQWQEKKMQNIHSKKKELTLFFPCSSQLWFNMLQFLTTVLHTEKNKGLTAGFTEKLN